MKPITLEWIAKAEGDFAIVEREARARKNPNYDGLCFHAQQCAEKYLKARLTEAGIDFPKTHVLATLLDLVLVVEPLWEVFCEHFIVPKGHVKIAHQFIGGKEIHNNSSSPEGTNENGLFTIVQSRFSTVPTGLWIWVYLSSQK
jgi:hypothetical protein